MSRHGTKLPHWVFVSLLTKKDCRGFRQPGLPLLGVPGVASPAPAVQAFTCECTEGGPPDDILSEGAISTRLQVTLFQCVQGPSAASAHC